MVVGNVTTAENDTNKHKDHCKRTKKQALVLE